MKGLVLLAVAIGFLVEAPVANATLTIDAKPNPITFRDATTISGKLSDSVSSGAITLEANPAPFTTGFQAVATANVDADGNYSFSKVMPTANTRYRTVSDGCVAICPLESVVICPVIQAVLPCGGGELSRELLVEVRLQVAMQVSDAAARPHKRVRFFGSAAPAHDGLTVSIQRRRRTGRWVEVTHTTLKNSRFSRRFVPKPGRYRARVYHDADHADGTSRSLRVRPA